MKQGTRKIVIAGGTGFLGNILLKYYKHADVEIVVLTRNTKPAHDNVRYVQWDAKTVGYWIKELERSDVVINLVGKSVNCRYTEKNKREIIASRVDATTIIGQAINACIFPPRVWINAGSAAIFGNSGEEIKFEDSSVGDGFSPEVCKRWENAFNEARTPHTRKVFLRIGLVLQKGEGLIRPFVNMVKFGLGGKFGSGEQYISWIHEADFVNVVQSAISNFSVTGILHCSSPFPVKNKEFLDTIRQTMNAWLALPNPAFLVRFGALFVGTEADLVLQGRRVVSRILEERKFEFKYPTIDQAIANII